MIIYDSYGEVLLDTKVSDKSSLYCCLDNKYRLTLYFTLDRHVEIPIGSWCDFEGNRYEVMSDADVKMNHKENYDYTVVLSSYFALVSRYKVCNIVDGRLKFDIVAKPHEHLQMIVDNLNSRDGGWSIGSCVDSVEKLVSYNHTNCEEALVNIADTFNTEIEVEEKVISLKKVEYFKDDPLALSYGKGNGFRPGIQRTSIDDGLPVHRLFVQGGSRNISLKEYGSSELHLPKALSFKFDGSMFDREDGFVESYAKSFITDKDGKSVSVDGMTGGREDSLDLSDVYPSRVGKVTGVVYIFKGTEYTTPVTSWTAEDWNEVQIDIVDNTIPDSLDYNECLMENNEPLTVVFQSGMLAGRELNANYLSDKKRFQLIKQEFDGQPMPQDSFIPKVGDSYAVFNVYLPSSYISDATTYSGAEYNMLREASRYLYEKCVSEFNFAGEIDGMWAKKNWETVGPRIRIGSYVSFTHEKMFPDEPALVRIVGITQYVNNPRYPKIELSNSVGSSTVSSRLNKIENKDAHVEELYDEARRYTRRRYADIKQTVSMLQSAMANFSEGINPVTVETMSMLVGDERLQFIFTDSLSSDSEKAFSYTYKSKADAVEGEDAPDVTGKNQITFHESFIKHMTLGIEDISPVHGSDEYKRWQLSGKTDYLDPANGYYIYAKASKSNAAGEFLVSDVALADTDSDYYLLIGILNSEIDGERSFARMYGYTEVRPGQIVTESIRSSDGKTWLDLLRGILHLNDMAGVSGVKTDGKGDQSIAAWFGGLMKDRELDENVEDAAKSVIRHDGTGYFADGLFSWDDDGINLGYDQIKINYDGSIEFGGDIRIGNTGKETLDSLLTIVAGLTQMWSIEDDNLVTDKPVVIKNDLVVEGDMSTSDIAATVVGVTSILVNGEYYPDLDGDGVIDLSNAFNNIDVDLDNYYTREEVDDKFKNINIGDVDLSDYYTKDETYSREEIHRLIPDSSDMFSWADEEHTTIKTEKNLIVEGELSDGSVGDVTVGVTAIRIDGVDYADTDGDGVIDLSDALSNLDVDLSDYYTAIEVDNIIRGVNSKVTAVGERVTGIESWKNRLSDFIYIGEEDDNVYVDTHLDVAGSLTVDGLATLNHGLTIPDSQTLTIGGATLEWDGSALKVTGNLYVTGDLTDGGVGGSDVIAPDLSAYATTEWVNDNFLSLEGGHVEDVLSAGEFYTAGDATVEGTLYAEGTLTALNIGVLDIAIDGNIILNEDSKITGSVYADEFTINGIVVCDIVTIASLECTDELYATYAEIDGLLVYDGGIVLGPTSIYDASGILTIDCQEIEITGSIRNPTIDDIYDRLAAIEAKI